MIGSRGVPARAGGVERVVEELTRELSARGHEVLVYGRRHYVPARGGTGFKPVATGRGGTGLKPVAMGRSIITPGIRGKRLDAITHTATAMLDVLHRGVDVVHVHSPGPAIWSWIPALTRAAIVFTVHAPDWRRKRWSPPARWIIKAGLHCGMRSAHAVTAVSQALADELAAVFGREVAYVPNAARPLSPLPPDSILRWGLMSDGYVLHVGRIVPEKRLDLLLEAWRVGRWDRPLVVAGDFGEQSYRRRCRKLATGMNVRFLGPQYGDALTALYSHASLVVQPSELEGMSLALLEAASLSVCIIAADIPANRQAMGDSIVYFNRGDVAELTGRICRCLKSEGSRLDFGSRASRHVLEHYSWRKSAASMEQVYRQALRATVADSR